MKKPAETYKGEPCSNCGSSLRTVREDRCIQCRRDQSKRSAAKFRSNDKSVFENLTEQICKGCEKPFIPYNNRKNILFCSYACSLIKKNSDYREARQIYKENKPLIPCLRCGNMFVPSSKTQKYCSEQCREKTEKPYQKTYHHVTCEICGSSFLGTHKGKLKYCSPACRREGKNRKLKARLIERPETKRKYTESQKRFRENNNKAVRRYRYKNWYGITLEIYEAIYSSQNGQCAICKIPLELYDKNTHLDHDHSNTQTIRGILCGETIRGILCGDCNHVLGHIHDNPIALRNAANYLEQDFVKKMEQYTKISKIEKDSELNSATTDTTVD